MASSYYARIVAAKKPDGALTFGLSRKVPALPMLHRRNINWVTRCALSLRASRR
jgi:hypothetical protein